MGDLTKNISRYEIACKCGCGLNSIDFETINVVQDCCNHFANKMGLDKVILHISSGARCMEHNLKPVSEGGAGSTEGSWHPKCRAIDFRIDGVSPSDTWEFLDKKYHDRYGIGEYNTFTHLDTRPTLARWGKFK